MTQPTIVCILGSTKFKDRILGLTQRETLNGKIVLNHGFFHHVDMVPIDDAKKKQLDELMLRKIDIAHEVLVADFLMGGTPPPGEKGYIGNSTNNGIEYAKAQNKRVRYFSQEEAARKARDSQPRQ